MKLVRHEATRAITDFDSQGMTIGGIARSSGETRLSLLELDPGGVVGMHEAACPQLLLVVDGEGRVRGGDGEPLPIARGEAVLWDAGEQHETISDTGLTAIVVEADELALL